MSRDDVRQALDAIEVEARELLIAEGWTRADYRDRELWRDPLTGRKWSLWYALGCVRKEVGG